MHLSRSCFLYKSDFLLLGSAKPLQPFNISAPNLALLFLDILEKTNVGMVTKEDRPLCASIEDTNRLSFQDSPSETEGTK